MWMNFLIRHFERIKPCLENKPKGSKQTFLLIEFASTGLSFAVLKFKHFFQCIAVHMVCKLYWTNLLYAATGTHGDC